MRVRIISCFILLSLLLFTSAKAESGSSEPIQKYIEAINQQNWSTVPDFWAMTERNNLIDFLNNRQNKEERLGLYIIKKARLIGVKEVPYEYGKGFLPIRYIEKFADPQIFYVAVDYEVYKESKYFLNGVNYFFIVTVSENGQRKIVMIPHVDVTSIIRAGYGFGTADEQTFDEKRIKFVK